MISVVIPAFNRKDTVLRLLGDVLGQQGVEFETIVVDDRSADQTVDSIRTRFPQVRVLRNEVNRGPAITRNRGIREARGDIVVGFDSDVSLPSPHLLRAVAAAFAEHPSVEGFAFRLLQPDGRSEDAARWWHPVPLRTHATRRFFTDYFSGTAFAFRRQAIMDAGLFPEDTFMHYEEVELAYRLLDRGGSMLYLPELAVVHHEHQVSLRSEVQRFYKPRNQILLAVAYLPWPRALGYLAPRLASHFLRALLHGHLGAFFRALVSAKAMIPTRLARRRPLKKATFRRMAKFRSGIVG